MERVPSQEELVGLVGSLWGAGVANPGGQDVQPFIQRYGNGDREREREKWGGIRDKGEERMEKRERESAGGKGQDVCGKHIFVYVCACVDR